MRAFVKYHTPSLNLFPAATIGRMAGVQNGAASVAVIVAPILTGWLKQQTDSYEAPMNANWTVLVVGYLLLPDYGAGKIRAEPHEVSSVNETKLPVHYRSQNPTGSLRASRKANPPPTEKPLSVAFR